MLLIPFQRCTLVSSMPATQVVSTLQAATGQDRFALWSRPKETFIGKVDAAGFTLRRNISYRNSFLPVVNGTFETAGTNTLLHLRLGLHPGVLVFMCLWLGGVGLAALVTTAASIASKVFNPVMFVPMGMFLFGYALTMGGFLYERRRTLDELKRALSAVRTGPDSTVAS